MYNVNNGLKAKSGFTLIELLVVVLIIGILASMALPQYFKVVEKARIGEVNSTFAAIRAAQERYKMRTGNYASDFADLDITLKDDTGAECNNGASCAGKTFTYGVSAAAITATRNTTSSTANARYTPNYVITYTLATGATTCSTQNCTNELI